MEIIMSLFRFVEAAIRENGLQDCGADPFSYTLAAQAADGERIRKEMEARSSIGRARD